MDETHEKNLPQNDSETVTEKLQTEEGGPEDTSEELANEPAVESNETEPVPNEEELIAEEPLQQAPQPSAEESDSDLFPKETSDSNLSPAVSEQPLSVAEPAAIESVSKGTVSIKKVHLLVAAIVLVFLVVGAVLFGMWLSDDKVDPWEVDPNAKDYESVHINNTSSENISIPGYADVVLPANKKDVQLVLLNPDGNPCYFRFTLTLKESGEVLYTSGLVPPGQAITDLRLSRGLEKGAYTLHIGIETFSLNDRAAMNGANVETALTVR